MIGFTDKSTRALIAGLLGSDYQPGQMIYDLHRLRQAPANLRTGPSTIDHYVGDYQPAPGYPRSRNT